MWFVLQVRVLGVGCAAASSPASVLSPPLLTTTNTLDRLAFDVCLVGEIAFPISSCSKESRRGHNLTNDAFQTWVYQKAAEIAISFHQLVTAL